jgi:hypothetical protein
MIDYKQQNIAVHDIQLIDVSILRDYIYYDNLHWWLTTNY